MISGQFFARSPLCPRTGLVHPILCIFLFDFYQPISVIQRVQVVMAVVEERNVALLLYKHDSEGLRR